MYRPKIERERYRQFCRETDAIARAHGLSAEEIAKQSGELLKATYGVDPPAGLRDQWCLARRIAEARGM